MHVDNAVARVLLNRQDGGTYATAIKLKRFLRKQLQITLTSKWDQVWRKSWLISVMQKAVDLEMLSGKAWQRSFSEVAMYV